MKAESTKPVKSLHPSQPLQLMQAFDFQPPKSVRRQDNRLRGLEK